MFGRDPLKMIQGLATNDIAAAPTGVSVYTAFLTPKGKMIADARIVRLENQELLIECDNAAATNIASNLKKFVPPLFARFQFAHYAVVRGTPPHFIARLDNPFRREAVDHIVENAEGLEPLEDDEPARILAGEPKWGAELTEDVIPLEAGLKDVAISQTKGCYTGQEVIIRILHRGHVNRHLRGLLSENALQAGGELVKDGKVVGKITSAAGGRALGFVRREIEPGSIVHSNQHAVEVRELPFQ